jgi:hypothetical protein
MNVYVKKDLVDTPQCLYIQKELCRVHNDMNDEIVRMDVKHLLER